MRIELGRADPNLISVIVTSKKNKQSKEVLLESEGNDLPLDPAVGNWLYFGAAYAMVSGEDLDVSGQLDPVSAHNVEVLASVWKGWYPHLRRPNIASEGIAAGRDCDTIGVGTFFSGGLDSLFTLSKAGNRQFTQATSSDVAITHIVKLWHGGYLADNKEFAAKRSLFERVADRHRKRLVSVGTNLMTALPQLNDWWAFLTHAAAMSAVPHALSREIGTIIYGSSYPINHLIPWGSHPLTDPLLSSSALRVIHDGANYSRLEKTKVVCEDPLAMSMLNVCGVQFDVRGSVLNCSGCQKCLRTMLTLDLYGQGNRINAPTFDWTKYKTADAAKIYLKANYEIIFMEELLRAAEHLERRDIVAPLRTAIKKSRRFVILGDAERHVRQRYPWVLDYKTELKAVRDSVQSLLGLSRSVRS